MQMITNAARPEFPDFWLFLRPPRDAARWRYFRGPITNVGGTNLIFLKVPINCCYKRYSKCLANRSADLQSGVHRWAGSWDTAIGLFASIRDMHSYDQKLVYVLSTSKETPPICPL